MVARPAVESRDAGVAVEVDPAVPAHVAEPRVLPRERERLSRIEPGMATIYFLPASSDREGKRLLGRVQARA